MINMEEYDLKKIKDKCLIFNQFIIERTGMPANFFQETDKILEKAVLDKNVSVLKSADNDVNDQVKHMPLKMALEIKSILKDRLNIDFDAVEELRLKTIYKVVKRGEILKDEEYELILGRVDEIHLDSSKSEELIRLNDLLVKFHQSRSS